MHRVFKGTHTYTHFITQIAHIDGHNWNLDWGGKGTGLGYGKQGWNEEMGWIFGFGIWTGLWPGIWVGIRIGSDRDRDRDSSIRIGIWLMMYTMTAWLD